MKTSLNASFFFRLFTIGMCLFVISCSGSDDDSFDCDCDFSPVTEEHGLVLIFENQDKEKPANVSVMFKAETSDGEPLPNLNSDDFQIFENNALISAFESRQTILPKPGKFTSYILLLLDLSGSVLESESLSSLKEAAQNFANAVMPLPDSQDFGEIEMGIWWFDGAEKIHSLVSFTTKINTLLSGIDKIDSNISHDNSTNLYGAVISGIDTIEDKVADADSDNVSVGAVVIFTDGKDQAARTTREKALEAVHNADDSISIYTIGLGGETDETTLDAVGRDAYVSAEDIEELLPKFEEIANRIKIDVQSHYLLEYCSPKREGDHELKIVAEYSGLSGSLTTCFCASGFEGGCE